MYGIVPSPVEYKCVYHHVSITIMIFKVIFKQNFMSDIICNYLYTHTGTVKLTSVKFSSIALITLLNKCVIPYIPLKT